MVVLGQLIPRSVSFVGEACPLHVVPPLVVTRIVPRSPTATHVEALGQLIALSVSPWGSGFCQTHELEPTFTAPSAVATVSGAALIAATRMVSTK
jgi:hypothetical protein